MRTPALVRIAATALLALAWPTGVFAQEPPLAEARSAGAAVVERGRASPALVPHSGERVRFGVKRPPDDERETPTREIDRFCSLRARRDAGEPYARFGGNVGSLELTWIANQRKCLRAGLDPHAAQLRERSQASAPVR